MGKQVWKPGNMLDPVPAVLVSCADREGNSNILTVAWAGTVCSTPPMLSISVRPERYSFHMIRETGEFVVNLTTEKLARVTDLCGVKSGRNVDKWKETGLTQETGEIVKVPLIRECPVNLECRVRQEMELGSHSLFIAEVVSVHVDDAYMDEKNRFHLEKASPICYSHGAYFGLGKQVGTFGNSVAKKKKRPAGGKEKRNS